MSSPDARAGRGPTADADGIPCGPWPVDLAAIEAGAAAQEILWLIDEAGACAGGEDGGGPDPPRRRWVAERILRAIRRVEGHALETHSHLLLHPGWTHHRSCLPMASGDALDRACTQIARRGTMLLGGPHGLPAHLSEDERRYRFSRALYAVAREQFEDYEHASRIARKSRRFRLVTAGARAIHKFLLSSWEVARVLGILLLHSREILLLYWRERRTARRKT
jgi:hypothetical protein